MKNIKTFLLTLGLIGAGTAGVHHSAHAEIAAACVEMKWRSAVCVKMRVVYKGQKSHWKHQAICAHSHQCMNIEHVPAGEKYHIEIKAVGSPHTAKCGPNHRKGQPDSGRREFFRAGGNILPKWMGGGIWCDTYLRRTDWNR